MIFIERVGTQFFTFNMRASRLLYLRLNEDSPINDLDVMTSADWLEFAKDGLVPQLVRVDRSNDTE